MLKFLWRMVAVSATIAVSSTAVQAQPPRQMSPAVQRAREACDAAASRYGYHVMRRDQENVDGGQYQLPMHVQHGTTEADVTCRYDTNRGVAELPAWDDRAGRVGRNPWDRDRGGNRLSEAQYQAEQACENSINSRAGYRVMQVGTPMAHGARNWDVPVTVQRDGRRNLTVSCRYNTANGKVSLR